MPDFSFSIDDPLYSGAKINIGTDNPPTNILQNYDLGIQTTYTPTLPLPGNSVIYWQIFPYNELETLTEAQVYTFNTWSAVPNPVDTASPAEGSNFVALNTTLQWWDSNEYVTGYKLYISPDNPPQNYSEPIYVYAPNYGFGSNTPPPAPVLAWDQQNGILSWTQDADDSTPNSALTYDIRIGSSWDGSEIRCPDANLQTGYRRLLKRGQKQLFLPDLPSDQSFFVSIQAIDNSYAGSPFSNSVVINPFPEIASDQADGIGFGTVNLGLAYQEVLTLSNPGTGPLEVTALNFGSEDTPYSIEDVELPFTIEIGESRNINIAFNPQSQGTFNASLTIESNARYNPQMQIAISAVAIYPAPAVVTNVAIDLAGYDALVAWDAVTTTVIGTPLTPDLYIVLYNATEDLEDINKYYYLDYTEDPNYTHRGVARFSPRMFYRIVAFKDYPAAVSAREQLDKIISRSLAWPELQKLLSPPLKSTGK